VRNRDLLTHARQMRTEMTEPETRMWLQLRAKRFTGVKFLRQKIIANYIADFAANEPKLVVELDGDSHSQQQAYDVARTRALEHEGYRVIRFSNLDVMQNMDGVLMQLAGVIDELRRSPPPTPSPEGEGAFS